MQKPKLSSLLLTACALSTGLVGCQSTQDSKVSIDYYRINGSTTAALDSEIKRKGPKIDGGRHAVAVARIKMFPNITYENVGASCYISAAKVAVNARVTLPKWTGRKKATRQLGEAWDNIDRYTRIHEATHVSIAFNFARQIEARLTKLDPRPNCTVLRADAKNIVESFLKEHDEAQKKFDDEEQSRFALLAQQANLAKSQQ